jgi:hypothetical protein
VSIPAVIEIHRIGEDEPFVIKLEQGLLHRKTSQEGVGSGMLKTLWNQSRLVRWGMIFAAVVAIGTPCGLVAAEITTVRVQVNDAKTGEPIYQAHLTLRFREPGRFMRRSQIISYTSKTDKDGKSQFPLVPMGTITLMVTAPDHNTFGKEFEITKENQLVEVKLQKPHEVL